MSVVVRAHIGWSGQFTTAQADGAMPSGTRIRKVNGKIGDAQRNGATGRVLGSLANSRIGIGYFVEWDAMPQMAVFIVAGQIAPEIIQHDRKVNRWLGAHL